MIAHSGMAAAAQAQQFRPIAIGRTTVSVVVDVEEDFDWSGPFSSESSSVESLEWLNLGHTLMRSLGIRPAYVLTYPTVKAPGAAALIRELYEDGGCEIGAQLHPWVTPPFEEELTAYNSYPSNLPVALERRKNVCLIETIREAIGVAPTIYKAGRYGLEVNRAEILADLGFRVDTSVMPYSSFESIGGGPSFFGMPDQPFWLTPDRRLLGLPTTQRVVGILSGALGSRAIQRIFSPPMERMHLPGVLARLRLLERLRLSPEGFNADHCRKLIDECLRRGATCFVLSFHSPSLKPGCTPYVRNQAHLNEFLKVLYLTLRYLIERVGAKPYSVSELYSELKGEAA